MTQNNLSSVVSFQRDHIEVCCTGLGDKEFNKENMPQRKF